MKQLVVITTPACFDSEADILTQLFQAGMTRLHLRKPGSEEAEQEALISRIPAAFHRHIVLHDHFGLAAKWNLCGIHLNSRNPDIPTGFTGSVSRSCHTLDELTDVSIYTYVFLSPVFSSISKEGYPSAFSTGTLQEAAGKGLINDKVIALGGMDSKTIPRIAHLPFGGAAVLGALWGPSDTTCMKEVTKRYHALRECVANIHY